MSLTIKLRSPEVSENYTDWVNKTTQFARKYYEYNAPDQHEELYRAEINSRALELNGINSLRGGWATTTGMLNYLLQQTPLINPEEEHLIDFCCGLIAACIKFPNATIETY